MDIPPANYDYSNPHSSNPDENGVSVDPQNTETQNFNSPENFRVVLQAAKRRSLPLFRFKPGSPIFYSCAKESFGLAESSLQRPLGLFHQATRDTFDYSDSQSEFDDIVDLHQKVMRLNDGVFIFDGSIEKARKSRHSESGSRLENMTPICETDREDFTTSGKKGFHASEFGMKRNYAAFMSGHHPLDIGDQIKSAQAKSYTTLKRQLTDVFSSQVSGISPASTKSKPIKVQIPKPKSLRKLGGLTDTLSVSRDSESSLGYQQVDFSKIESSQSYKSAGLDLGIDRESEGSLVSRGFSENSALQRYTHVRSFHFAADKSPKNKAKSSSPKKGLLGESFLKARTVLKYKTFEVKKSELPCVIPREPRLTTLLRGTQKQRELQEKLEREERLLREQRNFKASSIPDYSKLAREGLNTHIEPLKTTQPIEIKLHTEQRAILKQSMSVHHDDEGSSQLREQRLSEQNQIVKPKPPKFDFHEFDFKTERRARERHDFDGKCHQKLLELRQRSEEERKRKEEEEIRELRKQLVFKATPISHYAPITIKKSDKPLVEPHSPKFHTRERSHHL